MLIPIRFMNLKPCFKFKDLAIISTQQYSSSKFFDAFMRKGWLTCSGVIVQEQSCMFGGCFLSFTWETREYLYVKVNYLDVS